MSAQLCAVPPCKGTRTRPPPAALCRRSEASAPHPVWAVSVAASHGVGESEGTKSRCEPNGIMLVVDNYSCSRSATGMIKVC